VSATAIITENRDLDPALIVVFLRGGADGLNLVVPHGDDGYYRARPSIGLRKSEVVDLDGFFGLNPRLAPLEPLWKDGLLGAVHGAGSEDETRSHFEAQDFMEHGGLAAGGWLGRFLRVRPEAGHSPLTAVAIGSQLPECLRGAPSCAALESIEEFGLGRRAPENFAAQLASLYGATPGVLGPAGANALAALARIEALNKSSYVPEHGAVYADDSFSGGLRQIAQLLKARVGLQAAAINVNGWDSHITQAAIIDGPATRLGLGLAAFARDLGPARLARTNVVVMTEFGRRVGENSAGGTDHGLGGVLFFLGGGVPGGRMHGEWTGLGPDILQGPGDLPVRHNYRDLLAPVLLRQAPGLDLAKVFPGHAFAPLVSLG
jgi:uncharacterized protein (DUF1501 family)